jgi:hypothetical protein
MYGSMQPLKRGELRFLQEGTHYADYFWCLTDFKIKSDDSQSLGNFVIYNNKVYKIISDQDFLSYTMMPTNQVETLLCEDNRLTFNGTALNIPLPQIDGLYAPLFQLVTMVNQCFTAPPITTIWAFQQELHPPYPYCVITLESIENTENTNNYALDLGSSTLTTNISNQLIVNFSFYAMDMIQAVNLLQQFKLNYSNYNFTTNQFSFIGFENEANDINQKLYEDRTVFYATIRMRFSWIVEQNIASTKSINNVLFSLNVR